MTALIVIGLLVGLPILLTILLRVNAALVLLAVCAGSVLQQFAGNDVTTIVNSFSASASTNVSQFILLILLFLPAALTILFLKKSISASKLPFNVLPAIATGLISLLLAVPLLPGGIQANIVRTSEWSHVQQFQSALVGAAILVSFLTLWMTQKHHSKERKHRK